jgi:hypothetical protein
MGVRNPPLSLISTMIKRKAISITAVIIKENDHEGFLLVPAISPNADPILLM